MRFWICCTCWDQSFSIWPVLVDMLLESFSLKDKIWCTQCRQVQFLAKLALLYSNDRFIVFLILKESYEVFLCMTCHSEDTPWGASSYSENTEPHAEDLATSLNWLPEWPDTWNRLTEQAVEWVWTDAQRLLFHWRDRDPLRELVENEKVLRGGYRRFPVAYL